jgi:hypothetical protein
MIIIEMERLGDLILLLSPLLKSACFFNLVEDGTNNEAT